MLIKPNIDKTMLENFLNHVTFCRFKSTYKYGEVCKRILI